jgi:hypothetical protein
MPPKQATWWQKALISLGVLKPTPEAAPTEAEEAELCCDGEVHIAYRGIADDRLYMAYQRKWNEVRFFKPNGLRVFCAGCRRRLF